MEPRILLEEPEKSYTAAERVSENDIFDNRLIFGDNLLALKALEQEFAGKVKCIFIDPPYNTGSAFTHYDDGLEHSLWLSMMRDRLEMLRRLLSEDGSIWITIDDNEAHYLKVLCDEVFGRSNFQSNVVWQKRMAPDNRLRLGDAHDSVLVYGNRRIGGKLQFNQLPISAKRSQDFKNPDGDPRGPWASDNLTGMTGHATPSQYYTITSPAGIDFKPPEGRCWALSKETFDKLLADNRIYFGRDGRSRPRLKRFLSEISGKNSWTWWPHEEVGHNQEAKKESIALFGPEDAFDTPKPERLMERILALATQPDDLVLDSFAGSGTTGAVAHKLGRRWIMIEKFDHCSTHVAPRMKKVIDGTDQGGISKSVGWKGGGGFRYYRLAPSLLKQDKWGRWVINDEYNPEMLAEAICKIEGYRYAPSDSLYWQHGQSTERAFIYVTTQTMTHEQLLDLSDTVGPDRTLLVSAMAFRGAREQDYPNLTLKKIPHQVLNRCEWGHDDYSLKVENLPQRSMVEGRLSNGEEELGNDDSRMSKVEQAPLFEEVDS